MDKTILPPTLDKQIDEFIESLREYNAKRPRPRRDVDYDYLSSFYKRFIIDQNNRAAEIESEAYQKVLQLALSQFPIKTMLNLCIDGRVLPILVFGASAIIGSSVRVPGGILREFIRGVDGKLKLRKDSYYASLIDEAFKRFDVTRIAEVYDSHLGCAARLLEEQAKGRKASDSGLLADISHKKQIGEAVSLYCRERYGEDKQVLPIQTSFDPHTGYLYMGLETDQAMQMARDRGGEYTMEVINALVEEQKIISTEKLAEIPEIVALFDTCFFPLDWKHEYLTSADMFWHAISAMKEKAYPAIEPLLMQIYPHLANDANRVEREERLLLLLTNTFSGFLLNHFADADNKVLPHMHISHYPFTAHEEEGVDVSEGFFPPNDISMFAVFSLDEKNLGSNIDLSANLVRKNRADGRVKDTDGLFPSPEEFVEATVPVVIQEVVRDQLSEAEWEEACQVSWLDLPLQWDTMDDSTFLAYLHKKKNMSVALAIAINNLRHRMASVFNPENPTSSHLVEHYKVALPLIVSNYRRNYFIVPFVKLGFS